MSLIANTSYSVQLPTALRGKGPCMVRVVEGVIVTDSSSANFLNTRELALHSNIPQNGFDTNSDQVGSYRNLEYLFSVDLSVVNSDYANEGRRSGLSLRMPNPRGFRCQGLPDQIVFSRYEATTGLPSIKVSNNYLMFLLEIEFDCQCPNK